ncbi:hypothetical protein SAMN04488063_0111 [Halopelagius inordinatus]|uniref:Uncharacterized protein n=1 Tax=Halopelagius inordinatus TaxID=553467 RepID=A0A1I2X4B2_9EURY|nr:hypothetical protein [Halopelagius inordinatus]SFH07779.1 hypothetical protein SAMN04488063_0111 [Halopelagius inordinatus]
MSKAESSGRDPYVGGRVSEELKRKAEMRARERGMNMTEHLIDLLEQDLAENAPYIDELEFE